MSLISTFKNPSADDLMKAVKQVQGRATARALDIDDMTKMLACVSMFPPKAFVLRCDYGIAPKGGWSYTRSAASLERISETEYNLCVTRAAGGGRAYFWYVEGLDPTKASVSFASGRTHGVKTLEDIKPV